MRNKFVARFRINGKQAGPEAFDPEALEAQVDEVIAQAEAEREQRQQEARRQCEERRKKRESLNSP